MMPTICPLWLTANRASVLDNVAMVLMSNVSPAVREHAIHMAAAELRRLDEMEDANERNRAVVVAFPERAGA